MNADQIALPVVTWLVDYVIRSTLVFAAVWAVTRALSDRDAGLSEALWKCALVISVSASFLPSASILPTSSITLPVARSLGASSDASPGVAALVAVVLFWLWVIGALAGLTRLAVSYRYLRRTIRDRRQLAPLELESFDSLTAVPVTITCSGSIQIPLAFGREVCIPEWAMENLTTDQLRAIVAHELEHISRNDAVWRWIGGILSHVFFFQPFNRVAASRLRELAECLCDEAAVKRTASPSALASSLGAVAAVISGNKQHGLSLVPSFASRESLTVRRVRRVLASRGLPKDRRSVLSRPAIVVMASAALVSLAVGSPSVGSLSGRPMPYVITAEDPAGHFTLTVDRGRVIGATISGRTLTPSQVRQRGKFLELIDPRGGNFPIELTPDGIAWNPRRPRTPVKPH